jgi:hypothetical protein
MVFTILLLGNALAVRALRVINLGIDDEGSGIVSTGFLENFFELCPGMKRSIGFIIGP